MDISSKQQHETYEVTLSGRFTFSDNPEFREIIYKIDDQDVKQVVLYMSQVEFVDSAALGMLLLAREAALKLQKQIVLRGATGQVKKMFDMAKFDTMFIVD